MQIGILGIPGVFRRASELDSGIPMQRRGFPLRSRNAMVQCTLFLGTRSLGLLLLVIGSERLAR